MNPPPREEASASPAGPVRSPSLEQVQRWRYLATAWLRAVGVGALFFSPWPFLAWFSEGVLDGDLFYIGYYWFRISMGCVLFTSGVFLLVAAAPLARVLLPVPRWCCPRCQYPVASASAACPECGLRLGARPPIIDRSTAGDDRRSYVRRTGN